MLIMRIISQDFMVCVRDATYTETLSYREDIDWRKARVFIIPGLAQLVEDSFGEYLATFMGENIAFVTAELYFGGNEPQRSIPKDMHTFANDVDIVRRYTIKWLLDRAHIFDCRLPVSVLTHSALFFIAYEMSCSSFAADYENYFCIGAVAGDMNSPIFRESRKRFMLNDSAEYRGKEKYADFELHEAEAKQAQLNFIEYYEKVLFPLAYIQEASARVRDRMIQHLRQASASVAGDYMSLLAQYALESPLRAPRKAPVLFLGDHDYIAPAQLWDIPTRANDAGNFIRHIIPHTAHYPHYENFEYFHAIIKQYLPEF